MVCWVCFLATYNFNSFGNRLYISGKIWLRNLDNCNCNIFLLLRLFLGLIYWMPYKTRYKNIKFFPKKCKKCSSKISIATSKYPAISGVYKSICECCYTEYKIKNKFEKIFIFNVKYLWIFYIFLINFILISALKTDKDSDYILILTFVLFYILYRIVLKILPVEELDKKI